MGERGEEGNGLARASSQHDEDGCATQERGQEWNLCSGGSALLWRTDLRWRRTTLIVNLRQLQGSGSLVL
jgi:hypothetical protein